MLATVATVIASQAVISGAFSVTQQVIQLGFLPRMSIRHTSERIIGQIYIPVVNWLLCAAVILLVLTFRSPTGLANAYGIALSAIFATNTLLAFVVFRKMWHKPLKLLIPAGAFFLSVELTFFVANLTKILSGGWFPLVVGGDLLHDPHDLAPRPDHARPRHARGAGVAPALHQPDDRRAAHTDPRHRRLPDTVARHGPTALLNNAEHNASSTSTSSCSPSVTAEVPFVGRRRNSARGGASGRMGFSWIRRHLRLPGSDPVRRARARRFWPRMSRRPDRSGA